MRTWVVTGGAVTATAALVLAAYAMIPSTTVASEPSQGYVERLELCVTAASVTHGRQLNQAESECFAGVLAEVALAGEIREITPALNSLNRQAPLLCHTPAHYAGELVLADPSRWPELIDNIDTSVCTYGLLHGAIEQVARLDWDLTEWGPLVKWCESPSKADRSPQCAHAIGHAAWDTYQDRASVALVCVDFALPVWEAFCGEGMVMQEFRPPGRPAEFTRLDRSADITGLCRHVAAEQFAYVRIGCLEGVGFVLSREFQDTLKASGPRGWTMSNLRSEVLSIAEACAQFGSGSDRCMGEFFFMVGFELYPMVKPAELCPRLGRFEELCLAQMGQAVSIIESGGEFMGTWDPSISN